MCAVESEVTVTVVSVRRSSALSSKVREGSGREMLRSYVGRSGMQFYLGGTSPRVAGSGSFVILRVRVSPLALPGVSSLPVRGVRPSPRATSVGAEALSPVQKGLGLLRGVTLASRTRR